MSSPMTQKIWSIKSRCGDGHHSSLKEIQWNSWSYGNKFHPDCRFFLKLNSYLQRSLNDYSSVHFPGLADGKIYRKSSFLQPILKLFRVDFPSRISRNIPCCCNLHPLTPVTHESWSATVMRCQHKVLQPHAAKLFASEELLQLAGSKSCLLWGYVGSSPSECPSMNTTEERFPAPMVAWFL